MTQQALIRPIEITDDEKNFTVVHTFGTENITLDTGVYASILTLVKHISAKLTDADAFLSCYLSADHKVVIASSAPAPGITDVTWTDPGLAVILGYRSNLVSGSTHTYTATYTPLYTWLPSYHSADAGRFWSDPQFAGGVSTAGVLSGISLTENLRRRKISWDAQEATNVAEEAAEDSFSLGGTTYYPERDRCFEYFVRQARSASPSTSYAEGLSLKGCYYVPNINIYTGSSPSVAIPASMDGGGHLFYLSSSPDRYIWCTIDKALSEPAVTVANSILFYRVEASLLACPNACPSWNAPS